MTITCWCCGNPSGSHKLSCNAKSKVEGLAFFLSELHNVPQDVLDTVTFAIYTETLERKLAFYEYQEESEKTWKDEDVTAKD